MGKQLCRRMGMFKAMLKGTMSLPEMTGSNMTFPYGPQRGFNRRKALAQMCLRTALKRFYESQNETIAHSALSPQKPGSLAI